MKRRQDGGSRGILRGELSRENKLPKVCRVPLGVEGCSRRKMDTRAEPSRAEQRVVVASGLQVLFGPFEAGPRGGLLGFD